ncbi:hypothetical protein [Caenispirillum salinarum]|uniref:hypothetical protein n=1 Tax=Caenispirillum salinarum TaxID=859058 RepID=UPI00384A9D35
MRKLSSVPIAAKLPAIVTALAAVVVVVTATIAYVQSSTSLCAALEEKLVTLRETRAAAIAAYVKNIREDLQLIASNATTVGAVEQFLTGHAMMSDAAATLPKLYNGRETTSALRDGVAASSGLAPAGTREVSSNIVGVNRAAGETRRAAGEVLDASGELSRQGETLRTEVDAFIARIRAA